MNILAQLSDQHERLRAHLEPIQSAAEAHDDKALRAALQAARAALTAELDAYIALEEAETFAAIAPAAIASQMHCCTSGVSFDGRPITARFTTAETAGTPNTARPP